MNPAAPLTLSSYEIADLVESRHDKVKQSIECLAAGSVIQLPHSGKFEITLDKT
jgi:phage regulator Rha-like protein